MNEENSGEFRKGMPFLGGSLWLDLLNTTPEIDGQPLDLVGDSARALFWASSAGIACHETKAQAESVAARTLRKELRLAFESMAAGDGIPSSTVVATNALLSGIAIRRQLHVHDETISLEEHETVEGPAIAAAAAADLARFIADFEPARLKHCGNPACTMVFYDRGKNNRRRWCSMAVCGNRHKVANYRARKSEQR